MEGGDNERLDDTATVTMMNGEMDENGSIQPIV